MWYRTEKSWILIKYSIFYKGDHCVLCRDDLSHINVDNDALIKYKVYPQEWGGHICVHGQ